MYRRVYGGSSNVSRQNTWIERERRQRERRYRAPPTMPSFLMTYSIRSTPRPRPRPHERDAEVWAERLAEKEKEKLREEKRLAREAEERRRLKKEMLEELRKSKCLLVEGVDLHIDQNTEDHHTDLFDGWEEETVPPLVVRRGQEFKLTFTFQREYIPEQDDMELVFQIGEEPNPRKGTYHAIKLREDPNRTRYMEGKKRNWGARIIKNEGNCLTVGVYAPPTAIIGEWEYSVKTIKGKKKEEYECEGDTDIIILLNPWCEDDQVFYTGESRDLNEYILNQSGAVYSGSTRRVRSRPWNYGQFQEGILEISLHLLRKANNYTVSRTMADPVDISRALSRILNCSDDDGVLTGRWDGEYSDGIKPTFWNGSAAILKKYMKQKCPVKYGQCWVFSHLLTTVSRALGLPCRSMTNFSSAHDTDLTMTIDKYVDEDGDEVAFKNSDSVWNFHVWNDVWINRPDLDKAFNADGKYSGWHAVDATPQELSDGVYQCGPAPLRAIKEGDVHVGYDTRFIFAEVNAERCNWRDGAMYTPPTLISKDTASVGKKMSTKCPDGRKYRAIRPGDDSGRLDVTNLYKYEEGSVAEREAVERATQQGMFGHILFEEDVTGVRLVVLDDEDSDPLVGEDLSIKVKVMNVCQEPRMARNLRLTVRPTHYWGGLKGKEKIAKLVYDELEVKPGESQTLELVVPAKDYLRLCDEALAMRVLAMCDVRGFDDPVFTSEDLDVAIPEIEVKGPEGKLKVSEEFEVEVTLTNPLKDRALTDCELSMEGTIVPQKGSNFEEQDSIYVMKIGEIKAGEQKSLKVKVKPTPRPRKSKEREVEVGLSSKELADMEGCFSIDLQ